MIVHMSNSGYTTSVNLVLTVVRVFLGMMIFSHGYLKVFRGGKIAGTAGWFESIGMKPGKLNAIAAASTELGAGVLLVLGLLTPLAAAGLMALMIVAIVTVHIHNGFFVFYKGQGVEYCLAIAVMTLVPGTFGAGRFSLDNAFKIMTWSNGANFVLTIVVGIAGAFLQLAAFYRPPRRP
jgi:putative oxidoreductase